MSAVSEVGKRNCTLSSPVLRWNTSSANLGELSGGKATGFVEDVWGQYKFVTVVNVAVDEVVEQGPFEACAVADVEPEAGSAHFDAAFVVDQAQMGDEFDVVLGGQSRVRVFRPMCVRRGCFLCLQGGTSSAGMLGRLSINRWMFCSISASSVSMVLMRVETSRISVCIWAMSPPAFLYLRDLGRDAVASRAQLPSFCDVACGVFHPR